MISRQEFEQLRRLIVMTREHFDQLMEFFEAHAPEGYDAPEDIKKHATPVGDYVVQSVVHSQILLENPLYDECGALTVRCGTCYRCYNCGNSLGCS